MKTTLLSLFVFLSIVFTACNLEGSLNNTPQMELMCVNLTANDTLNGYITDESSVFRFDTIAVGDTLLFKVALYGFYNNLTNFNLIQSDTTATKIIAPTKTSLDSIFSNNLSEYSKGKFVFKEKITNAFFPFRYIAKKVGNQTLEFYLVSDANFDQGFGYNFSSFKLKIPIVVKETADIE